MTAPHARWGDLPWLPPSARPNVRYCDVPAELTPATVRDIGQGEGSIGWVVVGRPDGALIQDSRALLWVDGTAGPSPSADVAAPARRALVLWCADGIAVHVPPDAVGSIPRIAPLDMKGWERWLPVARVVADAPFVATIGG
jgi:hypothetical protein